MIRPEHIKVVRHTSGLYWMVTGTGVVYADVDVASDPRAARKLRARRRYARRMARARS